ncbi:hypothetical protein JTB14_004856 [Gonioctena quinquepunctata]|nr:hypothetical protein JTB14_004856 [Gonioctena quinquepunctata]
MLKGNGRNAQIWFSIQENGIRDVTTAKGKIIAVFPQYSNKRKILLRVMPVKLHGPNGIEGTLALCDEASTVISVEKSVAENLGINGVPEDSCIQWTDNVVSK